MQKLIMLLVCCACTAAVQAEEAIFALGCFWSGESTFRNHETHELLPGITALRVGYAGGTMPDPTYENHAGYKEAVKITFAPKTISYAKLLEVFWHNVDPFNSRGQFCDQGPSYMAAIFYTNPQQKKLAEASKAEMEKEFKQTIVTEVLPATTFYDAEEYHQNYATKNSVSYLIYRTGCQRDDKLQEIWHNK